MGTGGGPLGTERSSAISPHASGELFAREVERASERASGTGAASRRLDELESERRETRRAGFGREREAESEARPGEAHLRPEHAPVVARPAALAQEESSATPVTRAEGRAPATTPGGESAPSSSPGPSAAPPGLATDPSAANAAAAVLGAQRAAPELAPVPAARHAEPAPVELSQILRTGATKSARHAALPAGAPGAPDAAVLERAAEILRQIKLHATAGVQRLTLDLEPAELGRLSVQLALRAGKVTAIVRAESAATLEALRQHEDEFQGVLAQRGLQADSIRFELGFGGGRSRGHERARAAAEAPREPSSAAPVPEHPSLATSTRPGAARLDTYA